MIALIQRVSAANVEVAGQCVARIGRGLLAFIAVEADDSAAQARRLAERILHYRVFADAAGKMNRSLHELHGDLLLVPQFTLAADTRSGLRPSFARAASPAAGRALFDAVVAHARSLYPAVAEGVFGADMAVSLTNDGPVTFWLQTGAAEKTGINLA